ncbi:MAG: hypothetical protein AAGA15_04105 [Pseudomonadota bacterium]
MAKPMIKGDHTFRRDGTFDGMISGNAVVPSGVTVSISGMIGGDLTAEDGAKVHLTGMVGGEVLGEGDVT